MYSLQLFFLNEVGNNGTVSWKSKTAICYKHKIKCNIPIISLKLGDLISAVASLVLVLLVWESYNYISAFFLFPAPGYWYYMLLLINNRGDTGFWRWHVSQSEDPFSLFILLVVKILSTRMSFGDERYYVFMALIPRKWD